MDPKALAEIDRQIAQLKKELNTLFTKRIAILQDEIKRSEAEAHALSAGAPGSPSPQAKAKRPRLAKPVPAEELATTPPERPARQRDTGAPATPPAPPEKPLPAEPEAPARSDAPEGETEAQIWNALKDAALFGLSQAEISKLTGLRSALVGSKLKELPGVTKKGSGRDARYYLKS